MKDPPTKPEKPDEEINSPKEEDKEKEGLNPDHDIGGEGG